MKLLALLLAILLLVLSNLSKADCIKNVQKIENGTSAPCSGWLVKPETMQEIMKHEEQLELQKKLQLQLEHLRKLDNDEIDHYRNRSTALSKDLDKAESKRFWSNAGFFALGIIMTGIAAKAAIEAGK